MIQSKTNMKQLQISNAGSRATHHAAQKHRSHMLRRKRLGRDEFPMTHYSLSRMQDYSLIVVVKKEKFCHHLLTPLPKGSLVKLYSSFNISRALKQNSAAAFSWITDADGDLSDVTQVSESPEIPDIFLKRLYSQPQCTVELLLPPQTGCTLTLLS